MTLRRLLLRLALAVAVPLALLAVVSTWFGMDRERARFDAQLVATARALAIAVDAEIARLSLTADLVANATSLAEGDLARFAQRAQRDLSPGMRLSVLGRDGRAIVEVAASAGTPHGALPPHLLDAAFALPGAQVSDFATTAAGEPVILATKRVLTGGEEAIVVLATPSTAFGQVLRHQRLAEGWVAAVVDRGGRVVARTRAEEEFLGAVARPWTLAILHGPGEGVNRGITTHDGMWSVTAVARAPASGYGVAMAAPAPGALHDLMAVLAGPLLIGAALLLAALLAARRLSSLLLRGIAGLAPGAAPAQSGILELDRAAARLREAEAQNAEAMRRIAESEARYRVATEAFAGGVYECRPLENTVLRSPGMLRLLGETSDVPHRDWWFERVHPADLPALHDAYARVKGGQAEQFELQYRMRHRDGHWVWIWHRSIAWRDADGTATRLVGSFLDVTAERDAREAERLLAAEMDHRVKNTFSLLASIARLTAHDHPEAAGYVADLDARIAALNAAHELVRRGAEHASLHGLVARLAAAHAGAERVRLAGEDWVVRASEVPQLALILHEWITNAVKHGALSGHDGHIEVTTRREGGTLVLGWREHGGPPVAGPPATRGFGSTLAALTVQGRLGGTIDEVWAREGLHITLRMDASLVLLETAAAAV